MYRGVWLHAKEGRQEKGEVTFSLEVWGLKKFLSLQYMAEIYYIFVRTQLQKEQQQLCNISINQSVNQLVFVKC